MLFRNVLEYPLALMMACAIAAGPISRVVKKQLLIPLLGAGLLLAGAMYLWHRSTHPGILIAPALGITGILVLITLVTRIYRDRRRLGLVLALICMVRYAQPQAHENVLFAGRSFFGVYRVTADLQGTVHYFYHGRISHGLQYQDAAHHLRPYGTYYDPQGPLGGIFELVDGTPVSKPIAVVGLGAGAMIYYAQPQEKWDFYEIDPLVIRIASESSLVYFFIG